MQWDALAFIGCLVFAGAVIVALVHLSQWRMNRREVQDKEEKQYGRKKRRAERYSNIHQPDERVVAARIHAIANKIDEQTRHDQREAEGRKFREWFTIAVLIITFVAVGGSDWFFYLQLGTMQKQLAESQENDRAWITVPRIEAAPNPPSVVPSYFVRYGNVGHSPTVRASSFMIVVLAPSISDLATVGSVAAAVKPMAEACPSTPTSLAIDPPFFYGFLSVIPGAPDQLSLPINGEIWRLHATVSKAEPEVSAKTISPPFWLTGCITYETGGKTHHTGYCFDSRKDANGGLTSCIFGNHTD